MIFIEILKAIFFGIVEGITEWLPVSSTGHLILLDTFIHLDVSEAFYEMFQVVIQLGAILAVIVLFFHKLNPFAPSKSAEEKIDLMPIDISARQVLALKDGARQIYHIMHSDPPTLADVMQAVDPNVAVVDDDTFSRILQEKAPQLNKEFAALLMDHWRRSKVNPPVITVTNKLTQAELRQAGFHQEIPDPEQLLLAF